MCICVLSFLFLRHKMMLLWIWRYSPASFSQNLFFFFSAAISVGLRGFLTPFEPFLK